MVVIRSLSTVLLKAQGILGKPARLPTTTRSHTNDTSTCRSLLCTQETAADCAAVCAAGSCCCCCWEMRLTLEFSGGLELLFGGQKQAAADVPDQDGQLTVGQLLPWVRDSLLQERPELFLKGASVRPGILVLINECDWELSGTLSAPLQEGDTVMFISTLHGG